MTVTRRLPSLLLCATLIACGGDAAPLPPLVVGSEWMPLTMDTTGSMMMRRVGLWVDTVHVTRSDAGYARSSQRMHMDMKIGGMSTTMQMRTEFDCGGRRYRVIGIDSLSATMNGTLLPDSIARQAAQQQQSRMNDTTWKDAATGSRTGTAMLTAVCAKLPAATAP